ncbi:MAG TPA: hypothetical protein VF188_12210 [Longimicrobiales bacterium]
MRRLVTGIALSSVAAAAAFPVAMFAVIPAAGPVATGEPLPNTLMRVFGLTFLLWLPPTLMLTSASAVPLFFFVRRKGVTAAWPFLTAGLIEGAVFLSLAWRWFWGLEGVEMSLSSIGALVGGLSGFVFWLCVRSAFRRGAPRGE